jgi:hypothetical protein
MTAEAHFEDRFSPLHLARTALPVVMGQRNSVQIRGTQFPFQGGFRLLLLDLKLLERCLRVLFLAPKCRRASEPAGQA